MNAYDAIDSTAQAAFATDGRGTIVAWNEAAEDLLGYPAREVCGERCHTVLAGTDVFGNLYCCELCPLMRMVRRHQALHRFELDVRTAQACPVRTAIHALLLPDASPDGQILLHILRPLPAVECPAADSLAAGSAEHPPLSAASGSADSHGVLEHALTPREREILRLLGEGAGTRQIAATLFIGTTTARNHIQNILRKLGAHTRLEAVARARRERLL